MKANNAGSRRELYYAYVKRQDGSVRQLLVQDGDMNVIDRGYYSEGTTVESIQDNTAEKKYHWADSFNNAELCQFGLEGEALNNIRAEAVQANKNKVFVHNRG